MQSLWEVSWWNYLQGFVPLCSFIFVYYTLRTKIPMIPTQKAARDAMLTVLHQALPAKPNEKIKIYDLGSGWGGLCLAAAKEFPFAEVVGLELAWPAWIVSWIRMKVSGRRNLSFLRKNFWHHDISDGDVVLFYLGDVVMERMGEKLLQNPKANRMIVSNTFPLPTTWTLAQTLPVPAFLSQQIYVYRQGA